MKHELVDYFDDNGRLLGQVDKVDAHRIGLWHKAIHVWIINSKGQALLQYRCKEKNFYPNHWDVSVGGHVGAGEESLAAALREVKEEIGVKLKSEEFKYAFTYKEKLKYKNILSNEIVDVYIVHKDVNLKKVKLQKEEVAAVKYFDLDMVLDGKIENFLPHECINLLKKYFGDNEKGLQD